MSENGFASRQNGFAAARRMKPLHEIAITAQSCGSTSNPATTVMVARADSASDRSGECAGAAGEPDQGAG